MGFAAFALRTTRVSGRVVKIAVYTADFRIIDNNHDFKAERSDDRLIQVAL